MSDEITTVTEMPPSPTAPAVIEALPDAISDPNAGTTPWQELTDSQKLDILHMKVDAIGNQVAWIGQTFQGVISMVGNVGPMDIFKMMRGGK